MPPCFRNATCDRLLRRKAPSVCPRHSAPASEQGLKHVGHVPRVSRLLCLSLPSLTGPKPRDVALNTGSLPQRVLSMAALPTIASAVAVTRKGCGTCRERSRRRRGWKKLLRKVVLQVEALCFEHGGNAGNEAQQRAAAALRIGSLEADGNSVRRPVGGHDDQPTQAKASTVM